MSKLEDKILKSIRETLPESMAKELRVYLEEGEQAIERVKYLETMLTKYQDIENKNQRLLEENQKLKDRAHEVEMTKLNFEKLKIEHELKCEKEKMGTYTDLVRTVFKNPSYITHKSGNVPIACPPGYSPQTTWSSVDTTTEVG